MTNQTKQPTLPEAIEMARDALDWCVAEINRESPSVVNARKALAALEAKNKRQSALISSQGIRAMEDADTIAQQAERIKELEAMGDRAVVAKSIDVLHEEIAMLNAIKCDCKNIIPPSGPSRIECSDKQMMSHVKKQAEQLAAVQKDAERLAFLDSLANRFDPDIRKCNWLNSDMHFSNGRVVIHLRNCVGRAIHTAAGNSVREAIDAIAAQR